MPTSWATSSSGSSCAARPDDDRLDVLDVRAEPLQQGPARGDDHPRQPLGVARAATARGAAGPSSRPPGSPARTAASPRPGTARPASSPRNWARSSARRSAAVPVGVATTIGRRPTAVGQAGHGDGAGRLGHGQHRRGRARRRGRGRARRAGAGGGSAGAWARRVYGRRPAYRPCPRRACAVDRRLGLAGQRVL